MNRPDRRSILCIGIPGSGKTVMTLRICDAMLRHPGYDSVFVLDRLEQHSVALNRHLGDLDEQLDLLEQDRAAQNRGMLRTYDGPLIQSMNEYYEFCGMLARARDSKAPRIVPERVIWRCGPNAANYAEPIAEACNQGNVVLVLCETRGWFSNYQHDWPIAELPGRPDVTMEHLLTMGRAHIRNRHGEYCAVHMIYDAQDFGMLHWMVRRFTQTVLCSRLEGGESYRIVGAEFGDGTGELVQKVRALRPHQWIAVRGEMPEVAPFRGGGR